MADDDPLAASAQHLAAASEQLERWQSLGRVRRVLMGGHVAAGAVAHLTAASQLLNVALEHQRALEQLRSDAISRLELVTAGDERLLDDVGAALEEVQRRLEVLQLRVDGVDGEPPDGP